ncbi:MAG TPA: amidohydrolase [Acidobacteriota bacterium]|nr:amidohydrolase [Acidobacteriota bacterium]
MCTLILFNADVITMDPGCPRAELVAVDREIITAVGGNELLGSLKEPGTRVIDCRGSTLIPGFVDAHCHLRAYAEALVSPRLSPRDGIRSIADIGRAIAKACDTMPAGTWIRAKGYSEFHLAEKRHPDRHDLDAAAPRHPVILTHRSGHAHALNSFALRRLKISAATEEPPGGMIDRDLKTGAPTGIFYGMGNYLAGKMPRMDDALLLEGAKMAEKNLLSFGVTSIHDVSPSNNLSRLEQYKSLKEQGVFRPRVAMALGWEEFLRQREHPDLFRSDKTGVRVRGVKIVVNEATGSLHPGIDELNARLAAIHEAGCQAIIHAIEPAAIEAAAEAVAFAVNRRPRPDHRHRIEHCSVCPPPLRQKLAGLGVTVVTQPAFIYYSGDRYIETVPADQIDHLYPTGSLMSQGVAVAFSSDFPISDPCPLAGIGAAVTRMTEGGRKLLPEHAISVADALRAYTLGAAAAMFEEKEKGSIAPGKFADMVMLGENPYNVNPVAIRDIEALMTILAGAVAWRKPTANQGPLF